MKSDAHSRDLRVHRLKDAPATFFITKSLHPKRPALDVDARQTIVSALAFAVEKERIHLRSFVVMPDHWHALFALRQQWTLAKLMRDTMSFVGAKTSQVLKRYKTSWQDSYYDTRVKTAKQFEFVVNYIEQNPVVKGLVNRPEEWDASSASSKQLIADPWPFIYD